MILEENKQYLKDHYVYALMDSEGIIKYIGEGRKLRYKSKVGRSKEYLELIKQDHSFVFLYSGLTKEEAFDKETELLNLYLNKPTDKYKLINKKIGKKRKVLTPEYLSQYFKIDYNSPTLIVDVNTGEQAGTYYIKSPYNKVVINNASVQVHRIIWVLFNNKELHPSIVVDHIDGNTKNNHPSNLQAISYSLNSFKAKKNPGYTGIDNITYSSKYNNYIAKVTLNGNTFNKAFSVSEYGDDAVTLAILYRDYLISKVTKDGFEIDKLKVYEELYNKHKEFPHCLCYKENHGDPKALISVSVNLDKNFSKSFSVKKYGKEEAIRLAIEWREQMIAAHSQKDK